MRSCHEGPLPQKLLLVETPCRSLGLCGQVVPRSSAEHQRGDAPGLSGAGVAASKNQDPCLLCAPSLPVASGGQQALACSLSRVCLSLFYSITPFLMSCWSVSGNVWSHMVGWPSLTRSGAWQGESLVWITHTHTHTYPSGGQQRGLRKMPGIHCCPPRPFWVAPRRVPRRPGSVLYAWGFAGCFKYSVEAGPGDSLRGEVHHLHFMDQDTEPQTGHVPGPGHRAGGWPSPPWNLCSLTERQGRGSSSGNLHRQGLFPKAALLFVCLVNIR